MCLIYTITFTFSPMHVKLQKSVLLFIYRPARNLKNMFYLLSLYFILNFLKIYKRILPKLDNVEPEIIKVCQLFFIVSKQFAWKFKIIGLFDIFWLKIALFVSISIGLWWSPLAAGKHVFQSTYIVSNFRLKNWIERKLKKKEDLPQFWS